MVYVAGKPASIFTAIAPEDGLHVVPVAYDLLARRTGSPKQMQRRLNQELDATGDSG